MSDILHNLDSLPAEARGCVLTIGNFDGVHLGHQRILLQCRMLARAEAAKVVVLTFDPPPEFLLRPQGAPPPLAPVDVNCRLLRRHGADLVVIVRTTGDFLQMSARQFIDDIVVGRFAPRHVVEGQDFFFGRARMGSVDTLQQAQVTGGFVTHVVDSVTLMVRDGQRRVSSTLIRELVAAGDVEAARDCLGREFALYGAVVPGARLGRKIGFPTINVDCRGQVLPGDGVYAGHARLDAGAFLAAISVGTRPTVHPHSRQRAVEAFLLEAQGEFYGQQAELTFRSRLRDQKKFAGEQELKEQIESDVALVKAALG